MNRVFLTAISLFIFTSFMSLNAQWAIIYERLSLFHAVSIQQTIDGGYIVLGSGLLILKLSSAGDIEWSQDVSSSQAYSIQQTSDGGYIVAGYTSYFGYQEHDLLALKLSPAGDIEWQKAYAGGSAFSIQQTMDGGYIVAGWTGSFVPSEGDFCILKLSPAGDIEWQKTYGRTKWGKTHSIQQTMDWGYIVAGETNVLKLSPAGDIEWQKAYAGGSAFSIQQTMDGGYIVAGWTGSFVPSEGDLCILKLSPAGDIEWQKAYAGSDASLIQQTMDGGYIVAGGTNSFGAGGDDFLVLKLSPDGEIEWQKTYGGSEDEFAKSIKQTSDGGYIVAGETCSFGTGEADIWALKLSSGGDIEWQKIYGSNYSLDRASSIQQTSDGGYIIAGDTQSWGTVSYVWISPESNILVLKLTQDGDINPLCAFIKSSHATVLDTVIMPEDTEITPIDTYITPENTGMELFESDVNVYKLCVSGICNLNISASDGGTTDPTPGIYTYDIGTEITIEAIPSGDGFIKWSGNVFSEKNPITITMDGDKSIKANFVFGDFKDPFVGIQTFIGGGGCFIATAAYGSLLHPYVKILRDFRDSYLMPSKAGRKLVELYYKYSPFFANLIAKHKALKVVVRFSLLPVIAFSYSMVHFGPTIPAFMLAFVFALPIFFIWFYRRKLSRPEAKDPKALASRD